MSSIGFFKPSERESEIKRRRMMAQQLSELGKNSGNEVVGGMIVEKSPLEQITKGLATGFGSYENARANSAESDLGKDRAKLLAEALSLAKTDQNAAATMLAQDPATADLGTKLFFEELSGKRQEDQFNRQSQLQRELAGMQIGASESRFDKEAALKERLARIMAGGGGYTVDPNTGQPVQTYSNKPLPTPALKLQSEAIDSLAGANNASQLAQKLVGQVDSGDLNLNPVNNLLNKARNFAGRANDESTNFANLSTELEKLRNDTLRLNKGVQTEGDAERAMNEVLQSVNDPKVFRAAMIRLQGINDRAAELQRLQVNNIRSNYNASPYDFNAVQGLSSAQTPVTPPPEDIVGYLKNKGMSDDQINAYLQKNGIIQ